MKRIVFCFDGTWNTADMPYPTNVTRIAQSISRWDSDGHPQIIHYDDGVGTGDQEKLTGRIYNFFAGVFGFGLLENIVEAYKFLVLNYEPGDKIYVFGFSRGAFTARSFAGLLRNCSIVSRRSIHKIRDAVDLYLARGSDKAPDAGASCQFRLSNSPDTVLEGDIGWRTDNVDNFDAKALVPLTVSFLGVWDTVGALGVPKRFGISEKVNRKYRFHDTDLSSFVESARHAVAADERRTHSNQRFGQI